MDQDAEQLESKSHKFKIIGAILVIGILTSGGIYLYITRGLISTDDAFVDGRVYTITPRVAGYITELLVEDNQKVEKGQKLVQLDPTEYEVAMAEAKANVAEAEFTQTSLQIGVPLELSQTEYKVKGAQAELETLHNNLAVRQQDEAAAAQELQRTMAERDKAELDWQRMTELRKSRAISQSAMDETETRRRTTIAQVGAAEAKLQAARNQITALRSDMVRLNANIHLAETGGEQAKIREKQSQAQKARIDLAKARLNQAKLNLSYTTITSPTDGFVTRKKIEAGVMVSRGQALFTVVPLTPEDIWVTANFKETQLTDVRPGQSVKIEVDTFPEHALTGVVDSIMAGTGAVFSLFPPENASGNYVKVVQRVPVKIRFDENSRSAIPHLRIGLSVIPTIDTNRRGADEQVRSAESQ